MDYGNPKVLPNTGAGIIFGSALIDQAVMGICIAGTVICLALIIRVFWRRNKAIEE